MQVVASLGLFAISSGKLVALGIVHRVGCCILATSRGQNTSVHEGHHSNFRQRLRAETGDSHVAVEAAFDALDTECASGLGATLHAHIEAIQRLLPAVQTRPGLRREFERLAQIAQNSQQAVGYSGRWGPRLEAAEDLHPIAAGYVLLGSRLGAAILKARMRQQSRQWSEDAIAYFTDSGSRTIWAALNAEIENVTEERERAKIIDDAKAAFGLFAEEAERALKVISGELCHGC